MPSTGESTDAKPEGLRRLASDGTGAAAAEPARAPMPSTGGSHRCEAPEGLRRLAPTDAEWEAAVRTHLAARVPALVPGGPAVTGVSRLAEDVWLVALADGGRVVAKHHFYGLLTAGEPYDLVRVEFEVLRRLRSAGCPVPHPFGADADGQFVLMEYVGPVTLADALAGAPAPGLWQGWGRDLLRGLVRVEQALAADGVRWQERTAPGTSPAALAASWQEAAHGAADGLHRLLERVGAAAPARALDDLLRHLTAALGKRPPALGATDYQPGNVALGIAGERLAFLDLAKLGWDWTERRAVQYTTAVGGAAPVGLLDPGVVESYGRLWAPEEGPARAGALDGHHLVFHLLLARRLPRDPGGGVPPLLAQALVRPLSGEPVAGQLRRLLGRVLRAPGART